MRRASLGAVMGLFGFLCVGGPAWAEGENVTLLASAAVPSPTAAPQGPVDRAQVFSQISDGLQELKARLPSMSSQDRQRVLAALNEMQVTLGETGAHVRETLGDLSVPRILHQDRIEAMMVTSVSTAASFGLDLFRDARRLGSSAMSPGALVASVGEGLGRLDRKRNAIMTELRRREAAPGVMGLGVFASRDTRALLDDLRVLDEYQADLLGKLCWYLGPVGPVGRVAGPSAAEARTALKPLQERAARRARESAALLRANDNVVQRLANKVRGTNGPALQ